MRYEMSFCCAFKFVLYHLSCTIYLSRDIGFISGFCLLYPWSMLARVSRRHGRIFNLVSVANGAAFLCPLLLGHLFHAGHARFEIPRFHLRYLVYIRHTALFISPLIFFISICMSGLAREALGAVRISNVYIILI
jgi:hypothetical protein